MSLVNGVGRRQKVMDVIGSGRVRGRDEMNG